MAELETSSDNNIIKEGGLITHLLSIHQSLWKVSSKRNNQPTYFQS